MVRWKARDHTVRGGVVNASRIRDESRTGEHILRIRSFSSWFCAPFCWIIYVLTFFLVSVFFGHDCIFHSYTHTEYGSSFKSLCKDGDETEKDGRRCHVLFKEVVASWWRNTDGRFSILAWKCGSANAYGFNKVHYRADGVKGHTSACSLCLFSIMLATRLHRGSDSGVTPFPSRYVCQTDEQCSF